MGLLQRTVFIMGEQVHWLAADKVLWKQKNSYWIIGREC